MREVKITTPDGIETTVQVEGDADEIIESLGAERVTTKARTNVRNKSASTEQK